MGRAICPFVDIFRIFIPYLEVDNMSTKDDVLKILISNSNDYISGERLALQLGKSRAAIWKAVKSLQKDGYAIDAVTNRGYRLGEENDILNAEIVKSRLHEDIEVIYYSSIDSTNTQAKRLINEGKNNIMLVICDEQTAGRGRQGKSFYSPALTGIYMSFVAHPMTALQNAVTSTTAAAVAVCRAVERLTDKKPKIKWVNDVYLGDKKICGILTEAVTDFETQTVTSVIIGIGMNIKTIDFPDDIENAASLNANVRRADLIAAIADELYIINNSDYNDFISYYRSHSMIIGEKINFIQNDRVTPATAVEIDETGGLVVRLDNGELMTLRSGEISIRKRI
jgi:BirA family biotin operon repressor/biotin-[acetyl-CoA-carboxylase] ligase